MGIATDPDQRALEGARDSLAEALATMGVTSLSKSQCKILANLTVQGFYSNRAEYWSQDRRIAEIGEPDAYTVGFARAVLPLMGKLPGLDWSKPLKDWSRDEMSFLLASGFEAIEEQRTATLENEAIPA